MDFIQVIPVSHVDFQVVEANIPSNYRQVLLEEIDMGKQQEKTVIIGRFNEFKSRKATNEFDALVKITYEEVSPSGPSGCIFHCYACENDAEELDDLFSPIHDFPSWGVVSNAFISRNGNKQKKKYSIKITKDCDPSSSIIIFHQTLPHKPVNNFVLIKDVANNEKQNIFAVVKEVLKAEKVLNNNTRHTMLALVDPSCTEPTKKMEDFVLHIFLNRPKDKFLQPFHEGDVLRLRHVLGEYVAHRKKLYGKVYNSEAVVHFPSSEDQDDITPITTHQSYQLSEEDENQVKLLKRWWKRCTDDLLDYETHDEENVVAPTLICDITDKGIYDICGIVRQIRPVNKLDMTVLEVIDGTRLNVLTSIVDLVDATQDLVSQTDAVISNSNCIYVNIFGHENAVKKIKVGDCVLLECVTVSDIGFTRQLIHTVVLDFYMNGAAARIRKMKNPPQHLLDIINSESLDNTNGLDEESEGSERTEEETTTSVSGETPSGSAPAEIPLAEPPPAVPSSKPPLAAPPRECPVEKPPLASSDLPPRSPLRELTSDVPLAEPPSAGLLSPVPPPKSPLENHPSPVPTTELEHPSALPPSDLPCGEPQLPKSLSEPQSASTPSSASTSLPSGSSLSSESTRPCGAYRSKSRKRNLEREFATTSKRNKTSNPSVSSDQCCKEKKKFLQVPCSTDITEPSQNTPWMTLNDFVMKSEVGKEVAVWAFLKHIHCDSEEKGCPDIQNFCKDWVWGLCQTCNGVVSSAQLRRHFSETDLRTSSALPCTSVQCSSVSTSQEADGQTNATVIPFIRLKLCLVDPENYYTTSVNFSGDAANLFFGISATFKWVIDPAPLDVITKTETLSEGCTNIPHHFCLLKLRLTDGTLCNLVQEIHVS